MTLPSASSITDEAVVQTLKREAATSVQGVTLELDGEPAVVVITPAAYEELVRLRDASGRAAPSEQADPFAALTPDEIDELVKAEVDAVREEMYRAGRQYG